MSAELSTTIARALQSLDSDLERRFLTEEPIAHLVRRRAVGVARQLRRAWQASCQGQTGLVLLAVGGSGRGQLHPYSDIDLLVLARDQDAITAVDISSFVNVLWDAGLILGHSVRTLAQALQDARDDVVFLTNLMEARWLAGEKSLLRELRAGIAPVQMWSPAEYYRAKFSEQVQRHERYHDTAYNLEPNIKESPGGLRDLQMITWVAMRRFGGDPIKALLEHGLLTDIEADDLRQGRDFLWRVRWGLHRLAKRAEERLLFEYQIQLAEQFGFRDVSGDNRGVEQFMQQYYRTVMQLERLNERVLQQYQEEFLAPGSGPLEVLDDSFQIHNGYLEVRSETVFVERRHNILELFLWLQRRPEIAGVRASTIRLVRQYLHLIDENFRQQGETWNLFLQILQQPRRVYQTLQRMNRYGVLAEMIPAFRHITGRMQFDLFHVYTVDQHILFVIRNLRRISNGLYAQQFGHAIAEWPQLAEPYLLYLAALFHDIAKGRGGDHSLLGKEDAAQFCQQLDIPKPDRRLVGWLVENHLLFSQTAQRQDISDPEVVHRFANQVGDERKLRYLYLLTIADISATAPRLWTSWKDSLLWDLYQASRRLFEQGLEAPLEQEQLVDETQEEALVSLRLQGITTQQAELCWRNLADDVFVRLKADQLAWMTHCALQTGDGGLPCVEIRTLGKERVTELFVHAEDFDGLFAAAVSSLEAMRCNILAARIITSHDQRSWDLFQLVDANGHALVPADCERLSHKLRKQLLARVAPKFRAGRVPRRLREFLAPAQIRFESGSPFTLMWLECTDRPGLLSLVAEVLMARQIRIHDARIATFGDRAEDLFTLSDRQNNALDDAARAALDNELRRRLDAVLKEH